MPTPHISAQKGDFSKVVLMPGDPLRAQFIAENFLKNAKKVTDVRNIYGFTGEYENKTISVMASGMGMPSIGIYSHELYTEYGVESIIRIGTAGTYSEDIKVKDIVLSDSVYSTSSFNKVLCDDDSDILYPSEELNKTIELSADELGKKIHKGRIYSTDVFYADVKDRDWKYYKNEKKCVCCEMESFGLFAVAKHLNKKAACIITISDSFVTKEITSAEERQTAFTGMMEVALKAAVKEA